MNFIYMLYKENNDIVKIGSTRCPIKRLAVYKTSYYADDDIELKYYRLYLVNRNCYDVDDMLKYDINRGFDRCREIGHQHCGTEFYRLKKDDVGMVETWLTQHDIQYKLCDVATLVEGNEDKEDLLNELLPRASKSLPIKITLRGYQINVYDRMVTYLETHKKASLEVFCGGGKTVLYQKYILDTAGKYNVCVLVVPTLNLLHDMYERFIYMITSTGIYTDILQVGSHTHGTTKRSTIDNFVHNNMQKNKRCFILSTYQSAHLLKAPLSEASQILMIFDECHKCCTLDLNNNILHKFRQIEENIKHMIFATATPKFTSNDKCVSMDKSEYFGDIICNIPMVRLIRERFLCTYKIIVEKGSRLIDDKNSYYNASLNILKKYIHLNVVNGGDHKIKKILMYTNSINNIETIYSTLTQHDFFTKFSIFKAHSNMSTAQITLNKNKFIEAEGVSIMVNCQLFTEGINIPELDSVVFCDPKYSEAEIIQCFGRALRVNPKDPNKVAKIFIPICEDDIDDKFSKLVNIIKVISTQDPKLRDEIRKHKKMGTYIKSPKASLNDNILNINISDVDYKELNIGASICTMDNLSDVIMYILRDHIPRSSSKIYQEIEDRELYTHMVCNQHEEIASGIYFMECDRECVELCKKNKLMRTGDPYLYYIPKVNRLTTEEFVRELINKNIESEEGYRIEYEPYNNPNFPFDPIKKYKGFEWKHLLVKKYYTLQECMQRLQELEEQISKQKLLTDLEKNNYISKIDPKVPKNLGVYYKKKLSYLNSNIFEEII